MKILHSDPKVEVIFINIFGGIAKCDTIVLGIINAMVKLGVNKPIVVRLKGTNVE